ncbi:uncharacterized protein LOC110037242 isoform X2 [Phalaenopsis equestris]|uniref:uncharacterized protein LOC110037242 isoform X2 n=1 Tax=Phalaenopsis equestris TaxID=78828 RepID=UPI0009E46002|nr:uncharacterized protein LOC110037242 isoform X2 [Phalaenopsis equestris]
MCAISWAQPFQLSDVPLRTKTSIPASKIHSALLASMDRKHSQHRRRILLKSARKESDTTESYQIADNKLAGSENASSTSNSFLSVLCPLLKFFGGGDPSRERNEFLEVTTSSLSSVARLPWGSRSLTGTVHSQNPPMLQVYEFEACPFCRRVREAMTELDLSSEVYPCPKGSRRHREIVRKIGGKEHTGDIVRYLFQQYGQGRSPSFGLLESTPLTGWVPTLLRAGRGMTLWDRTVIDPPLKMMELFSYENNPFARIVREAICELELPYVLHNVGEGSSNTELLVQISGSNKVPFLVDPNTGTQMGDYKKILSYLFQTYSAAS